MWLPQILCYLSLSLLTVTDEVKGLASDSFLLCPVRTLQNDPAWHGASPVPLSTQGQQPSALNAPEHAG